MTNLSIIIEYIVFKNWTPCSDCVSETSNRKIGNAKDIDVVMSTNNLVEYRDNYSKTLGTLWKYYRDEPY